MSRPDSLVEALPNLRGMTRRFWPYFRAERGLLVSSTALLMASTALRLLEPWPLKVVFDALTGQPPTLWFAPVNARPPSTMQVVTASALALAVITVLRAFTAYLQAIGFAKASMKALTAIRDDVYRKLQKLSLSFHTRSRSGDLVVRLINDVNMLKDVAVTAVAPLLADAMVLVGMWIMLFWINWRLALLALATVPLIWLRTVSLTTRLRDASRKQRLRQGAMAATASESLTAIKSIQALTLENHFAESFVGRSRESQKADLKTARLSAQLARSVDAALAVATALILWYGARLVLAGTLTAGDLLVVITYLKRAFRPLEDFSKYAGRLAKAAASGERIIDILQRKPEVRDARHARTAPPLRGELVFDGVTFAYEPGHPVLDQFVLHVPHGRRVVLVGRSGIGKSTALNLVLRLFDPQSGRVLIGGDDIADFTIASLREQIAVVLQDGDLFAGTVRQNIAIGVPGVTDEQVVAAATVAGADEFVRSLPQGYETRVGERGATLSRGQRQRIAIARAAIRNPPILILDEPTTGLDEHAEREVLDALLRLSEGRTTLWVTHDVRHVLDSDHVAFLAGGRVVEEGLHVELIARGGRYARLHDLQAGGVSDAKCSRNGVKPACVEGS